MLETDQGQCDGANDPFAPVGVDLALTQYLTAASRRLSEPFEEPEERQLFVQNTFEETRNHERLLCLDRVGSQALELFLPAIDNQQLSSFASVISCHLGELLFNPFASHVVQCLLLQVTLRLQAILQETAAGKSSTSVDASGVSGRFDDSDASNVASQLEAIVTRTADVIIASCVGDEFKLNDQYASYIVRTCLECLSGRRCTRERSKRRSARAQTKIKQSSEERMCNETDDQNAHFNRDLLPESFGNKLSALVSAIGKHPALPAALTEPCVSAVVQTALRVLHESDRQHACGKLIKRLSRIDFGESDHSDSIVQTASTAQISSIFQCDSRMRLLEVAVMCADQEVFSKLFTRFFSGRVCCLLMDSSPSSHLIAVQKLIDTCNCAEVLGSIIEEALQRCPHVLEKCTANGTNAWWRKSRIALSLAKACVRLSACQTDFLRLAVLKCYGTSDVVCDDGALKLSRIPPDLVTCLLYEVRHDQLTDGWRNLRVSMNSSLLIQTLLHFSRSHFFLESLIQLPPEQLASLCQCQFGSHVIDTLLALPQLGDSRRQRLLHALLNHLLSLVTSRHGSRVLENLWNVCGVMERCEIAEALSPHRKSLRGDFYARFAYDRFALELFVNKKEDWMAYVKREANKRRMFADFISQSSVGGATGKKPRVFDSK